METTSIYDNNSKGHETNDPDYVFLTLISPKEEIELCNLRTYTVL